MSLKEIIVDVIFSSKMAKKYILLYALGTFCYGLSAGLVLMFLLRDFFDSFTKAYIIAIIIFFIGFIFGGPAYSKILRNYDLKEKK